MKQKPAGNKRNVANEGAIQCNALRGQKDLEHWANVSRATILMGVIFGLHRQI